MAENFLSYNEHLKRLQSESNPIEDFEIVVDGKDRQSLLELLDECIFVESIYTLNQKDYLLPPHKRGKPLKKPNTKSFATLFKAKEAREFFLM